MVNEEFICHASGNRKHKFIYGFYLYYLSVERDKSKGNMKIFVLDDRKCHNEGYINMTGWVSIVLCYGHSILELVLEPIAQILRLIMLVHFKCH